MSEENVETVRRVHDCWPVAVFVKLRARPKESSAEIEALIGHLFTLRDALIVRLRRSPSVRRPSKPPGCRSRPGIRPRRS
jgi:hypothetical protein